MWERVNKSTVCRCQCLAVYKMSKFLHENDNYNTDDTKTIAILRVFPKNSCAKTQLSTLSNYMFRLFQIQSTRRQQIGCGLNIRHCHFRDIQHCEKMLKDLVTSFSHFPTMFLKACYLKVLNPFPNKPRFLHVCSTSLSKTLWEKEKLLVTINFSFSHSVFYPFEGLSTILINLKLVVCKIFQFGRV